MRIFIFTFILSIVIVSSIHSKSESDNVFNQVFLSNSEDQFHGKKEEVPQQSSARSRTDPNNSEAQLNFQELFGSFSKLLEEINLIIQPTPPSRDQVNPNTGFQFLPNGNQYSQNGYQNPINGYQNVQNGYQSLPNGYQIPQNGYQNPINGYQYPQNGYQNPINGYQIPQNGYQNPINGYQYPQNGYQYPQNGYQFHQNGLQSPFYPNSGLSDAQCASHIKAMEMMYVKLLEEIKKEVKLEAEKQKDNGVLQKLVSRFDTHMTKIRNIAGLVTLGISDKILNKISKKTS